MTLARLPVDDINALHRAKDRAYGDAWKKRGELIGVYANLARKVDRLEHHDKDSTSPDNESLAETLIDLYVYALKYLTFLADHDPGMATEFFPNAPPGTVFSDHASQFEQILKRRAAVEVPTPTRSPSAILVELERSLLGEKPIETRSQLALELANSVQYRVQELPSSEVESLFEKSPNGVI